MYYKGSVQDTELIPKVQTAFSAENSSGSVNQSSSSSGFSSYSSVNPKSSTSSHQFQNTNSSNGQVLNCNIALHLQNGQNFSKEVIKGHMSLHGTVLESYEDRIKKLQEKQATKNQKEVKCESVDQEEKNEKNEEVNVVEKMVEAEKVVEVEKITEVEKIVEVIKPCLKCLESCKQCEEKDEKLNEFDKMKEKLVFDLNYVKESYDGSGVIFDPLHNSCCDLDIQKNTELANFSGILEFMGRIPIQKALTDQRPLYKSHIECFWKNASYDDQNKVISSIVEVHGKMEKILVTEALIREVVNFPDEAESPTRFPERMVKGCMLRMGYQGALNAGNYLKSKFQKPYKFLIHCVLMSLSHTKGSYDTMHDYQMNMVTALVLNKKYNFSHIVFHYMAENIKTDRKSWMYPRFVQMLIDHAYPEIDRNIKNDLLIQSHMSNDLLKQLVRYHPNHQEPKVVAEFFGFIKDANYVDPDPVDHQKWRNEAEMKEAAYVEELKILEDFKNTKNEWYVKETGRRRRKATPIVQKVDGSSSQPKKKQKKAAKTSLIDEPEEDETVVAAEEDPFNVEEYLLFDTDVLETGPTMEVEAEHVVNVESQKGKDKVIDDIEGYDVDKDTTSSSSSSEEEVDETERLRRIQEATKQEKLLRKRKRQEKDDDEAYVPSLEHVSESQSPPGDFDFANTSQVKNVEKKVDEVIAENKKLAAENKKVADRERILEMRVKRLEGDNKELLKKIDSDQSEIDILKVRVAELEEEKARRDEQNEYFKLKNKELEAAKAFRDHEFYMLNIVVESMLGTSVEQKFEELQVEELRAERQAKIDEQMKDKGKGVGSSSAVAERSIVPSMVVENPEPISAISGLFEEDTPLDELIGDSDEEDDDEEDDEEDEKDEKVYSASSHSSGKDDDDDDAQGGTGLKVTEASTEKNVNDLMNDSVN
ncbi:interaptin-like [Helianthus annuus]|uniref:interaptin-like n=1 Tax=Helianthus annuus TaxID=4232 RepID=UPI000B900CC4|nr:interaptin-like [Helianthus annuus]